MSRMAARPGGSSEVNRLSQDELVYQLAIRGLPEGTVEEMRKLLRAALRRERQGDIVAL